MYLSKIQLDKTRTPLGELARLFQHGHPGHVLAWQALGGGDPDKNRDFLFREERASDNLTLWTLSPDQPDDWGGNLSVQSKVFAPSLREGMTLGFKLRANPTICVKKPGQKRGTHHDVVMHHRHRLLASGMTKKQLPARSEMARTAGLDWLGKQGERHGFELEKVLVDGYMGHRFRKNAKSSREVFFHTLDFDGILTVTDSELFLTALCQGMGRTKAYGNGLMLIRKV